MSKRLKIYGKELFDKRAIPSFASKTQTGDFVPANDTEELQGKHWKKGIESSLNEEKLVDGSIEYDVPFYEDRNAELCAITMGVEDIYKDGIPKYYDDVEYKKGSLVTINDFEVYTSRIDSNLNNDPPISPLSWQFVLRSNTLNALNTAGVITGLIDPQAENITIVENKSNGTFVVSAIKNIFFTDLGKSVSTPETIFNIKTISGISSNGHYSLYWCFTNDGKPIFSSQPIQAQELFIGGVVRLIVNNGVTSFDHPTDASVFLLPDLSYVTVDMRANNIDNAQTKLTIIKNNNLTFGIRDGIVFGNGVNYKNDKSRIGALYLSMPPQATATFLPFHSGIKTSTTPWSPTTIVDVTKYDNNGTLSIIGNNSATVHRILTTELGEIIFQYSPVQFSASSNITTNFNDAITQAYGVEFSSINDYHGSVKEHARVIVTKNTTSLSNSTQATWLFSTGGSSSSGIPDHNVLNNIEYSSITGTQTGGVIHLTTADHDALKTDHTTIPLLLPKSGGVMTGSLDMGVNKVTSSFVPNASNVLCNKAYVDSVGSQNASIITWQKTTPSTGQWHKVCSISGTEGSSLECTFTLKNPSGNGAESFTIDLIRKWDRFYNTIVHPRASMQDTPQIAMNYDGIWIKAMRNATSVQSASIRIRDYPIANTTVVADLTTVQDADPVGVIDLSKSNKFVVPITPLSILATPLVKQCYYHNGKLYIQLTIKTTSAIANGQSVAIATIDLSNIPKHSFQNISYNEIIIGNIYLQISNYGMAYIALSQNLSQSNIIINMTNVNTIIAYEHKLSAIIPWNLDYIT